ncbi:hypothetical protein V499_05231 [Pseudogymnoascus sp. VKM F-103]|nr:hypothetical protein V499_05231 [Pseudogymnoascus sp. VKM F-103]
MHHNHRTSRQQLRPPPQIPPPLTRNLLPKQPLHHPPHHPRRHNLTPPRHRRQPQRTIKIVQTLRIPALRAIKREVRVRVSISAIVQDEDLAQEGRHAGVLGEGPDEQGPTAEARRRIRVEVRKQRLGTPPVPPREGIGLDVPGPPGGGEEALGVGEGVTEGEVAFVRGEDGEGDGDGHGHCDEGPEDPDGVVVQVGAGGGDVVEGDGGGDGEGGDGGDG